MEKGLASPVVAVAALPYIKNVASLGLIFLTRRMLLFTDHILVFQGFL